VENLGIGLAREGKRVLLVDTDPQGSLMISLGYPRSDELKITLFDLLDKTINEDSVSAGEGILHQAEGIDLIPANISLAGLEVALVNTMNRERILKQFLEPVKGNYDYVLLDCMPSLGMLTVNALAAADADKKNAFDIEKFLNHRLTLKPDDRYTVVKPDEVKMDR
jgi:chromosome partitioning protein